MNDSPKTTRIARALATAIDTVKRDWQLYLMLIPTIVWLLVFLYKPMYGLQIAFKDYSVFKGIAASPWIGFEHFYTLFGNDQFWRAVKNTVVISFFSLLIGFPMPILLALMFNEILRPLFKRVAQTIVYLPHFISAVIIAGIVIAGFSPSSGVVNTFLGWFGISSLFISLPSPNGFALFLLALPFGKRLGFPPLSILRRLLESALLYMKAPLSMVPRAGR